MGSFSIRVCRVADDKRFLCYSPKFGINYGIFNGLIVKIWNGISCRIFGHDDILVRLKLDNECCNCCKKLTGKDKILK